MGDLHTAVIEGLQHVGHQEHPVFPGPVALCDQHTDVRRIERRLAGQGKFECDLCEQHSEGSRVAAEPVIAHHLGAANLDRVGRVSADPVSDAIRGGAAVEFGYVGSQGVDMTGSPRG
ncbi:hypothetical protein ABZ901_15800 [Actinacidiphila alni]|uniref:hypothetical protein n=1 Tax=Actinacidiphila alni TaxID=380248 RepID=UPI0033C9D062